MNNIYLEADLYLFDIHSEPAPMGGFATLKQNAITISLYGHSCRVASVEDLVRIKETLVYLRRLLAERKT